jgi:hypothetical protein
MYIETMKAIKANRFPDLFSSVTRGKYFQGSYEAHTEGEKDRKKERERE